ncbi:hypothetical protein D3C85_1453490 [compost metagenome]
MDLLEIGRPVLAPHRLEHLDRGDAVEPPLHIAIVDEADATARIVMLLSRDGDAGDDRPDLARRELGEAAPAAADFKHAMPRLQVHHPRQRGVFGALCVL